MSEYLNSTNTPFYAVATALPLLICYEVLVVITQTPYWAIRNAADVWMRTFLLAFELKPQHLSFLMIGVLIVALPFAKRFSQGVELRPRYFAMILGESLIYSIVLGIVLRLVLSNLLLAIGGSDLGLLQNLALSIGAGLFEEFFFRVLLLGVLFWFAKQLIPSKNLGGVLSILLAAFLYSCAHVVTKRLSDTESGSTVVFYMSVTILVYSAIPAFFVWQTPNWADIPAMIGLGITGYATHYCITRSLAVGDASFVIVFDFMRLPFSALLGWLLFTEILDGWTAAGALVIFAAGYYSTIREAKASG